MGKLAINWSQGGHSCTFFPKMIYATDILAALQNIHYFCYNLCNFVEYIF